MTNRRLRAPFGARVLVVAAAASTFLGAAPTPPASAPQGGMPAIDPAKVAAAKLAAESAAQCDLKSPERGAIVGTLKDLPRIAQPSIVQVFPDGDLAQRYFTDIATTMAVRGTNVATPAPEPVTIDRINDNVRYVQQIPNLLRSAKTAVARADGAFRCFGLAPGSYRILARVPIKVPTTGLYTGAGKTVVATDFYEALARIAPPKNGDRSYAAIGPFKRIARTPVGI